MRRFGSFIALAVMALTLGLALQARFAQPIDNPIAIAQPDDTLSTELLLASGLEAAQTFGLTSITSQDYLWTTYGEWMGESGFAVGVQDPSQPVLVIAMRGEGFWSGPGGGISEPMTIDGVTIVFNGETGRAVSVGGGYFIPDGTSGVEYRQILDHPTLAPVVEGLLRQTEAAPQPLPATLP
jgi:hypothetical protein